MPNILVGMTAAAEWLRCAAATLGSHVTCPCARNRHEVFIFTLCRCCTVHASIQITGSARGSGSAAHWYGRSAACHRFVLTVLAVLPGLAA